MKNELQQFIENSKQAYSYLKTEFISQWRRDLPFDEMLFDRWDRAKKLGFGDNTSVYHNSYIYGDVKIGENTWIGPFTLLDGSGKLKIGSFCSISAGVQIYTHDTVMWAVSSGKESYQYAPVNIGDCCYIGSQSVINKGINIGEHSIIGACSFVNRDIPAYTIAFGVPCRPLGRVKLDAEGNVSLVFD